MYFDLANIDVDAIMSIIMVYYNQFILFIQSNSGTFSFIGGMAITPILTYFIKSFALTKLVKSLMGVILYGGVIFLVMAFAYYFMPSAT